MQPARHGYAGGNTCAGFVSYFQEVLPLNQARRLYLLKGGPGVGKSSLMRKLAAALEAREFAIEYLHCSSDPDSLDGILCAGLGVAVLDGTAPHVVDPALPGAVDGIVNLGMYLNEGALETHRPMLRELMREKAACFRRAYRYLEAAAPLYADAADVWAGVTDAGVVERLLTPWLDTLAAHRSPGVLGKERRLFAEAVTPKGVMSYLHTLALPRLWRISGAWGSDAHGLLQRLRDTALRHGLDVESLMDPCLAGHIRHLIVPALGLFITTEEDIRRLPNPAERSIDLRVAQPESEHFQQQTMRALAFNHMTYEHLVAQAVDCIAQAGQVHAKIEQCYVAHMDFEGVQAQYDRMWAQLMRLMETQTDAEA